MPYLRLYSLELPREIKRTLVTELTQAVVETRHLVGDERDAFTIHFVRLDPEDLAIGGKLVANGRRPDCHVEYSDHGLTGRDKKKLAHEISTTVSRVLEAQGGGPIRINVMFRDYLAQDFAVGGAIAVARRPSRLRRLARRLLGRIPIPVRRSQKVPRTVTARPA